MVSTTVFDGPLGRGADAGKSPDHPADLPAGSTPTPPTATSRWARREEPPSTTGVTGYAVRQRLSVGIRLHLSFHTWSTTRFHARSTGPYSMIPQRPAGGEAQFQVPALLEMEVWAPRGVRAPMPSTTSHASNSDDVLDGQGLRCLVGGAHPRSGIPEKASRTYQKIQSLCPRRGGSVHHR